MALNKVIEKDDGTIGTYIRLIYVRFPEFRRDTNFQKRGQLTFNVYRDEQAAKQEKRQPFKQMFIEVDAPFFAGITDPFSMTFEQIVAEIYTRTNQLKELEGAIAVI